MGHILRIAVRDAVEHQGGIAAHVEISVVLRCFAQPHSLQRDYLLIHPCAFGSLERL